MRITFTARHGKASDKLREFAEKEVRRLKRYYEGIIDCEIVLDYVKLQQIAEINIKVYGTVLNAVVSSEDIYKSIDEAVSKLERQIKRYKGRWKKKLPLDKPVGM
ncbi:ribosome hibernation-promoting factor, HPF/YfiA family [candidate division KSB1 bacterium]